jgi:uncharacterized protein YecT (DUF1311 family)
MPADCHARTQGRNTHRKFTGGMMKRATWVLILGGLFAVSLAQVGQAASFDCTKAKSALERTICSSPQLDAADARMGEAYRAAVKAFPIQGMVQATQKTFLRGAYANCLGDGRSAKTDPVIACIKALEIRNAELAVYQQARVYANPGRKYDPETIVFMAYSQGGKARLRYYGSWMPDAYRPAPFPDGHMCDDDLEVKTVKGALVLDDGNTTPIKIQDDKLVLGEFISCSPRTGIAAGEYKRAK